MSARNRHYPEIQGEFDEEFEYQGRYSEGEGPSSYGAFEFEFESEAEAEYEDEFEDEAEAFINPVRRVYRDAEMMAHLARQASTTESEGEAEAFIGALVPLASKLIPRAARLIARNAPTLVRGATQIARQLRRDPATRKLVRAMPVVLQRTAQSLADQAAAGKPINMRTVAGTLSKISGRVLGPGSRSAVRAVDVFDRRWHRRARWEDASRWRNMYPQIDNRSLRPRSSAPMSPAYVCPR